MKKGGRFDEKGPGKEGCQRHRVPAFGGKERKRPRCAEVGMRLRQLRRLLIAPLALPVTLNPPGKTLSSQAFFNKELK